MQIYDWPIDWYRFTETIFTLEASTLRTTAAQTPRVNAALSFQAWFIDLRMANSVGPHNWQKYSAFFSRLEGETNLFRIGDPLRCMPQYNYGKINTWPQEPWSDDTYFTDNTGWLSAGLVPPSAEVLAGASRGDKFIQLRGLPVNTTGALSPGDLIELRVNGVPGESSNLYEVVVAGPTNANGETGVEIRPGLRQGFAEGDMAVLWKPRGTFRLVDNSQGRLSRFDNVGQLGFSGREHVT